MGYWSTHPMGGDSPADDRGSLLDYICGDRGEILDCYENWEGPEKQQQAKKDIIHFLMEKLDSVIEYADSLDCPWVLPYLLIELEHRIENENFSQQICSLIGDGGSTERGYNTEVEIGQSKEPYPHHYAQTLEKIWPDLMSGKIPFENVETDAGLFGGFTN